jgi:hypothetical protein
MLDPNDNQKFIIDEPAAEIVRELFNRVIAGDGVCRIANDLNRRGVDTSWMHWKRMNGRPLPEEPYRWSGQQVQQILLNTTYLGERVLQRLTTPSYKNHTRVIKPKEEWCVFPNHHEPIIDSDTFETVGKLRAKKRKANRLGEYGVLNGLLVCADCGDKLRIFNDVANNYSAYLCRRYAMGKCTRHSIRRSLLEELVLKDIQRVTAMARADKNKFATLIQTITDKETAKNLKSKTALLRKADDRIAALDNIIKKIYEDNVSGKITDERFSKMLSEYEHEQAELLESTEELREAVEVLKQKSADVAQFIKLSQKYGEITELTAEVVRTFIDKIVIHESEKAPGHKWKKISQEIEIYHCFIGSVPQDL